MVQTKPKAAAIAAQKLPYIRSHQCIYFKISKLFENSITEIGDFSVHAIDFLQQQMKLRLYLFFFRQPLHLSPWDRFLFFQFYLICHEIINIHYSSCNLIDYISSKIDKSIGISCGVDN